MNVPTGPQHLRTFLKNLAENFWLKRIEISQRIHHEDNQLVHKSCSKTRGMIFKSKRRAAQTDTGDAEVQRLSGAHPLVMVSFLQPRAPPGRAEAQWLQIIFSTQGKSS